MGGNTLSVFIERWRPVDINTILSMHWSRRNRPKKADAAMIFAHFHKKPKATGKRRVSLHITITGNQRKADGDAYWKSVLDGLVKCGQLIDDSLEYCEQGSVTYDSAPEWGTLITLEDL